MITDPERKSCDTVHYAAVRTETSMQNIAEELPVLWPKVYGWIVEQGMTPAGMPFIHYHNMMQETLDVSVGIPIPHAVDGSDGIEVGEFAAGEYLSTILTGTFDNLPSTHSKVHEWAGENGVNLGLPRENYLTDPDNEPDPNKWQTEVLYQII